MFYIYVFHKHILALSYVSVTMLSTLRELSHVVPTIHLRGRYYRYLPPPTYILEMRKPSSENLHKFISHSLTRELFIESRLGANQALFLRIGDIRVN